ncbi:hypothetical protein D9M72_596310 [compost metagenome]
MEAPIGVTAAVFAVWSIAIIFASSATGFWSSAFVETTTVGEASLSAEAALMISCEGLLTKTTGEPPSQASVRTIFISPLIFLSSTVSSPAAIVGTT